MITFFCIIISIILLAIILIILSTIKINIKELEITNTKITKFNLQISLKFLNKVQWIKITINKKRMGKLKNNKKLEIINKILKTRILEKYKNIKPVVKKEWKQILKQLNKVEIEKLELKAKIGMENAATTAISIGIISAIFGVILAKKIANPKYKIEPIYINKNYIYLSVNCIISLKLVHIISVRKELKGKEVYQ